MVSLWRAFGFLSMSKPVPVRRTSILVSFARGEPSVFFDVQAFAVASDFATVSF